MELLDRIRAAFSSRVAQQKSTWRSMVLAAANGNKVNENEIAQMLFDLGRTPEEFNAAVIAVKKRKVAKEKTKLGRLAAKEIEQLEGQLQQLHTNFEPIEAKFQADVERLQSEIARQRHVTFAGDSARDELIRTCTDEDFLARHEAARAEENEAQSELQQATEAAANCQAAIRNASLDESTMDTSERERYRANMKLFREKLESATSRLDLARKRVGEAGRAADSIRASFVESEL